MRSVLRLILLLFFGGVCIGDGPVDGGQIAEKHQRAVSVYQAFMRESFGARSSYEYAGKFLTDDIKTEVAVLALKAGIKLQEIAEEQEEMQKRIEGYGGFDWDERYGKSGLWRRLGADIRRSRQLKCKCDYYAATGLKGEDLDLVVEDIIERCSEKAIFEGAESDLMMLETMRLVSGRGSTKNSMLKEIEKLIDSSDTDAKTKLRAKLLKAEVGGGSTKLFLNLYSEWVKSELAEDIEFAMQIAFCEIQNGSTEVLKKITEKNEDMAAFVGQLVLDEIATLSDEQLKEKEAILISLAGFAAERYGAEKWQSQLVKVIEFEKFRSPVVLYSAGEALVEVDALKAGECFLEAAGKQQTKQDIWLRQNAREIAEKAARLVHRAYCQKPELLLNEAISTMEDYCDIAAGQADEQIRYVLAGLLMEADRKADGQNIYGQIAKANGKWSREAKLDIAVFNLSEAEDDKEKRWATHGEFKKLIDLERSAKIYCGLLLEREEDKYAQEVLGIVTDKMSENDAEAKLLHAETFRQLGRLVESVEMFYDISTAQIPGWDPMAIGAIADLLASGDENRWEDRGKPSAFLVRCDELAELLAGQTSTEWKVQADLVRAETAVLTGKAEIAEKLLNELNQNGFGEDIGWTRCKARLLSKKGEYTEAAKMWGIVQEARRGKEDGSVRSMRWWRGRFHEIECWSKRTDANGRDIVHAIEVLLYSVENIPEQWSDRFARLKKMAEARN